MPNLRILVVDDELLIRDLLYDYFSSKDYQIATADSAEEAIEILEQGREFDVVLTDIKMPGIGGLELVDRIKQIDSGLPVIIITGYPSLDTAIEALRKRVFDYVIKPFNINRLSATVELACKESREGKESHVGEKDAKEATACS
jgi:DNA-binding NtrC family response regulator